MKNANQVGSVIRVGSAQPYQLTLLFNPRSGTDAGLISHGHKASQQVNLADELHVLGMIVQYCIWHSHNPTPSQVTSWRD